MSSVTGKYKGKSGEANETQLPIGFGASSNEPLCPLSYIHSAEYRIKEPLILTHRVRAGWVGPRVFPSRYHKG